MVWDYGEIDCTSCKYCGEQCKRLDHEEMKFIISCYGQYDGASFMGNVCREFYPEDNCVWLKKHWKGIENFYTLEELTTGIIPILYKGTKYRIAKKDFYYGTMFDSDGNLKWISSWYMKRKKRQHKYDATTKIVWTYNDKKEG